MPTQKFINLIELVAIEFGVLTNEILATTRGAAHIALARQVAMYLARVEFESKYSEIGAAFNRDRTSVAHACCCIEDLRDNQEFDSRLEALSKNIINR